MQYPTSEEASNYLGQEIEINAKSTFCYRDYLHEWTQRVEEGFEINDFYSFNKVSYTFWPQGLLAIFNKPASLRRIINNNIYDDYYLAMSLKLCDLLLIGGEKKVIVYGGGHVGVIVCELLLFFGIDIDCVIDKNPDIQGLSIFLWGGPRIVSLDTVNSANMHLPFAIASTSYTDEIYADLSSRFPNNRIYKCPIE